MILTLLMQLASCYGYVVVRMEWNQWYSSWSDRDSS